MGKQSQATGQYGQERTTTVLISRGFLMVEQIGTPVKILGPGKVSFPYEKVSGDHRALLPGGRSVLVETKTRFSKDVLSYGDLEEHQRQALQEHHDIGGVSLVSWVSKNGCFIMQWPIEGWEKGKPLKVEKARSLDITSIKKLTIFP